MLARGRTQEALRKAMWVGYNRSGRGGECEDKHGFVALRIREGDVGLPTRGSNRPSCASMCSGRN